MTLLSLVRTMRLNETFTIANCKAVIYCYVYLNLEVSRVNQAQALRGDAMKTTKLNYRLADGYGIG